MKRSKIIFDENNQPKGVIYFHKEGNLVGCGAFLKSPDQLRPLNTSVATFYAKKKAIGILTNQRQGYELLNTLGAVIDLKKSNLSFQDLWKISRVVFEENRPYIMF